MKQTIIKSAVVKVMLSYNYNHFESSIVLENEDGITIDEINEGRKNCQRLCDKAVNQYQIAKNVEVKRCSLRNEKKQLETEVGYIKQKPESDWSVTDKAKMKALADHNWDLQFDYEDDWNDNY